MFKQCHGFFGCHLLVAEISNTRKTDTNRIVFEPYVQCIHVDTAFVNHLRQVRTEFLLFTPVLWPCVYRLCSILLFAAFVFFHLLVYFSVWCFPCRTHVLNSCLQNVWNGCKCVMIYIRNVALALVSDSSDANYPRLLGITRHQSWLQDHKLRKFLSLKFDFEYLKSYWTHCFNNLQMWTKCTLTQIFKISFH